MKKTKFAIIGNPISHSLSPIMHNYWFKKYKINAEYELLEIDKSEIQNVINKIKSKEIFIITGTHNPLLRPQKRPKKTCLSK